MEQKKISLEQEGIALDKQHLSIKNNMYNAIKRNDLEYVRKMMRLFQIDPCEEISTSGNYWTVMHYSIFFKNAAILELLVQVMYSKCMGDENAYVRAMNTCTKTGHNLLMLAAVYDTIDCLEVLFKYGGLHLFKKDLSAMDSIKLALKYDSKDASDFIQQKISQNQFNDFYPINVKAFKQIPDLDTLLKKSYAHSMDQNTIDSHRQLLLYGEPINCIICLQNTGFLKYSNCCGQPLHQHCHAERIIHCPLCKAQNFYLINEVLYPERAFTPSTLFYGENYP